jgi:hypothetical protein
LQTTIAELSVLYVYLYNDRPVMPLGFMQHLVTMGSSGPTLGDMIDIETLTFDIKPGEVEAIINTLLLDPLVITPRELREERARPLLEFIEELKKGEKSG